MEKSISGKNRYGLSNDALTKSIDKKFDELKNLMTVVTDELTPPPPPIPPIVNGILTEGKIRVDITGYVFMVELNGAWNQFAFNHSLP